MLFGVAGLLNQGHNDGRVKMQFVQGSRAGETYEMGVNQSPYPIDGEGPVEHIQAPSFWIATTETPVSAFAEFVSQTDYVTDAERFGWSFVFESFLPQQMLDSNTTQVAGASPWFVRVDGATWRRPFGPQGPEANATYPVTHVSWNDALAFCKWNKLRLPTELEWEYASRGKKKTKYPWGDKFKPDDIWRANIWTGQFPSTNTAADGFVGPAPVNSFPPVKGLYNMLGNVWEWTMDDFSMDHSKRIRTETDLPQTPIHRITTNKVEKGGSYLCHRHYCYRYRPTARTFSSADSSTGHLGFRCALGESLR